MIRLKNRILPFIFALSTSITFSTCAMEFESKVNSEKSKKINDDLLVNRWKGKSEGQIYAEIGVELHSFPYDLIHDVKNIGKMNLKLKRFIYRNNSTSLNFVALNKSGLILDINGRPFIFTLISDGNDAKLENIQTCCNYLDGIKNDIQKLRGENKDKKASFYLLKAYKENGIWKLSIFENDTFNDFRIPELK